jgi:TnpA family transposase
MPRRPTAWSRTGRSSPSTGSRPSRWEEILRVVVSIHTGAIRAYDVVTMLQREGRLSPLGEAVASYGRIFKTLHILTAATEAYSFVPERSRLAPLPPFRR